MRCSREIGCEGRLDVGLATLGCAGALTGADLTVVFVDSALLGDADRGDFFFAAAFFWVVLAFLAVFFAALRAAYLASRAGEPELAATRDKLKLLEDQAANDEINSAAWFDRVWVLLAELNFREKKYSDVVKVVDELRHRSPKSAFLHQAEEVLGRSFKQQAPPKFDDARSAFERVLADPFAAKTETAAKAESTLHVPRVICACELPEPTDLDISRVLRGNRSMEQDSDGGGEHQVTQKITCHAKLLTGITHHGRQRDVRIFEPLAVRFSLRRSKHATQDHAVQRA